MTILWQKTIMTLKEELIQELQNAGAALVGVGDMTAAANCAYPVGIAVAIPVPKNIIIDLQTKPTQEYYDMYYEWNRRLNLIVTIGKEFLINKGYQAYAQTTDVVVVSKDRISPIPHKTVATRAGLGWIGKNCLLVTKEYGSAVRISSLLTNAPLEPDAPYDKSNCGGCHLCVDACPAKALKNTLWHVGVWRDEIVDKEKCHDKQLEIMKESTGIDQDLCGKCFAVCAYTQGYLRR